MLVLVRALVLCDTAHKIGTNESWNTRIAAVEKDGIASIADGVLKLWFTPEFHEQRKADKGQYGMRGLDPRLYPAIIKAAQIIPDMPRIDLKRVQALRGIGIIDIAFDNIATDLIARRKIQNALEMARTMAADVVYAEKWLEGWLAKVKTDMAAIDQEYIAKKGALDNYRRQLMQQLCRT